MPYKMRWDKTINRLLQVPYLHLRKHHLVTHFHLTYSDFKLIVYSEKKSITLHPFSFKTISAKFLQIDS